MEYRAQAGDVALESCFRRTVSNVEHPDSERRTVREGLGKGVEQAHVVGRPGRYADQQPLSLLWDRVAWGPEAEGALGDEGGETIIVALLDARGRVVV